MRNRPLLTMKISPAKFAAAAGAVLLLTAVPPHAVSVSAVAAVTAIRLSDLRIVLLEG